MFTVLIAAKEHIDAIQQDNKLFFEPFLENKDLAFCYWNPEGQTLSEAVPRLLDAVGRQKQWRAVVINNCTAAQLKQQNPFDVVNYSDVKKLTVPPVQLNEEEEPRDVWEGNWTKYYQLLAERKEAVYRSALEFPLQKLSTWLCFRPEDYILNEVREKQDVNDWAMAMLEKGEIKPSVRLEQMEREHYKYEWRLKENIRREFASERYLNIAYPAEIHCISIRTAENHFFDPNDYWTVWRDSDYSTFADRNMYFDKMRFMVLDLLPQTHRNFRNDYIRFLATVLIFSSNPAPGSAMQARRLYRLEVDTDDTPLCTLVTSYDKKLASTFDVINSEMEQIRLSIPGELTDKAAEALFCAPQDVAVLLDESCNPDKVFAEKDYGLFFDSPENEFHKWNRNHRTSKKELSYIVKQQSRAIRKSVAQAHYSGEVSDVNISRLTPLQLDDVREFTDNAENEMVASIPPDLSDISKYTDRLDEASEEVKKVVRQRMTKKTTLTLTAVCLGIYLACFLPFLLNGNSSVKSVSTTIVFTGIMLALLGVVLFVTLLFLRRTVTGAAGNYNNIVGSIMADIQTSLKRFSKYLSAASNVRRGHAIQTYSEKNIDQYTKGLRIRKKHQEDIRRRRAYLAEEYHDYLCGPAFLDDTMVRPYEYDFDQKKEYTYPAPFLAGDCRQIEFLCSGNFVTVPSSYVTRILIRMEGLYD